MGTSDYFEVWEIGIQGLERVDILEKLEVEIDCIEAAGEVVDKYPGVVDIRDEQVETCIPIGRVVLVLDPHSSSLSKWALLELRSVWPLEKQDLNP